MLPATPTTPQRRSRRPRRVSRAGRGQAEGGRRRFLGRATRAARSRWRRTSPRGPPRPDTPGGWIGESWAMRARKIARAAQVAPTLIGATMTARTRDDPMMSLTRHSITAVRNKTRSAEASPLRPTQACCTRPPQGGADRLARRNRGGKEKRCEQNTWSSRGSDCFVRCDGFRLCHAGRRHGVVAVDGALREWHLYGHLPCQHLPSPPIRRQWLASGRLHHHLIPVHQQL